MILDNETIEEVAEARSAAKQKFDNLNEMYLQELHDHIKVMQFLIFLVRKHGLDICQEYRKFLIYKDEEELKKGLTKPSQ